MRPLGTFLTEFAFPGGTADRERGFHLEKAPLCSPTVSFAATSSGARNAQSLEPVQCITSNVRGS